VNDPIKLGITGGIGSGKSIICQILEIMGVPIYYADDRAKWLMNNDEVLKKKIIALFGTKSYVKNQLDRIYIASQIFENQHLLMKMNKIVHPAVADDFDCWASLQSTLIVGKEAALLFESGSYQSLDQTWIVTCPEEIRIARVKLRDPHRTIDSIKSIIKKQWSDEQKRVLADFEIINDGQHLIIPRIIKKLSVLRG
jgi:dephospho-CoA kinase